MFQWKSRQSFHSVAVSAPLKRKKKNRDTARLCNVGLWFQEKYEHGRVEREEEKTCIWVCPFFTELRHGLPNPPLHPAVNWNCTINFVSCGERRFFRSLFGFITFWSNRESVLMRHFASLTDTCSVLCSVTGFWYGTLWVPCKEPGWCPCTPYP